MFQMNIINLIKFVSLFMYTNDKDYQRYLPFHSQFSELNVKNTKNLSTGCSSVSAPIGPTGC